MDTMKCTEIPKKVEKKHKKLHTPNPQIWPILQAKQEMPELEMQEVV